MASDIHIPIGEIDVIYLSYDEPMKEKFWLEIKTQLPWATRVDGVKGSDAAHKAAAEASQTERFILIDGDNMPDFEFFKQTLILSEELKHSVFRWRARNHINALIYGNGGISCWTKDYIKNMKTHEFSDGRPETLVEFCYDPLYLAMHNSYSVTYPNGSPLHAWRAGFREGVKLCLDRGRKITINEFKEMATWKNIEHLNIWHSIGADVDHGWWAIYGARLGTYMCMLDSSWDYTQVQSFDELNKLFDQCQALDFQKRKMQYLKITQEIRTQLDLPCIEMDSAQSAFWKKYYVKLHRNRGMLDQ